MTKASAFWSSTGWLGGPVVGLSGCLVLDSFGKMISCRDDCLFTGLAAALWGGCRLTLTESLILAQDERWRRA